MQGDARATCSGAAGAAGELVLLSVGGRHFATTRTTLCAQGGMLAAMFGGEMQPTLLKDAEGRYFLDRDGTRFGTVLNYLRDGQAVLPADKQGLQAVRAEAAFFNLPALAEAAKAALAREAQNKLEVLPKSSALDGTPSLASVMKELDVVARRAEDEWRYVTERLSSYEYSPPGVKEVRPTRMELLNLRTKVAEMRLQVALH